MKKTILILSLLFSISAFSQNVSYTYTGNELIGNKNNYNKNDFSSVKVDKYGKVYFVRNAKNEGVYKLVGRDIKLQDSTSYYAIKLDYNKNLLCLNSSSFSKYHISQKSEFVINSGYASTNKKFDFDKYGSLWYLENHDNDMSYYCYLVRAFDSNKSKLYFWNQNPGLLTYTEEGHFREINSDNKGNTWFLMTSGLVKFDGTKFTNYTINYSNILPTTFICDTIGNLWFGGTNGLTKFDGVNWTSYTTTNSPLVSNNITALALDQDFTSVWIGTDAGISRFDGTNWQSYNYTNSNVPQKLSVSSLSADTNGNLWFSTNTGLSVLCKNLNQNLYNQQLVKTPICPGKGFNLNAPQGATNYYWSSGQITPSIQISTPGDYNVLIYDSLGCPYMTQTLTVSASDFQMSTPSLCMVTNNEKYNKLVWEQLGTLNVSKYKIYKQNTQNSQYEFYKNQDAKLLSEYIDSLSNPNSQIDRYKISYVDTCGNESPLSENHSSILLSTSMGLNNNINLSWNAYEGFTAPNYEIWRSIDGVNYSLLTSVANNTFSYVDLNAPTVVFYQIRVSKSGGCNPAKRGGVSYVGSNIKSINSVPLTINVNGVLSNQSSISLCLGDSIKLSGNNSGNYVWDNAILNNSYFKPTVTKTYQVSGTDGSGNVKTNSIEVVVNSKPKAQISASKITVCQGDSVVLTATGAKNSTWNNSVVNGVSFAPKSSLKYAVKVTDDNNCSDTSSVFVTVNLKPKAQIVASKTAVCQGDSVVLTATGAKNNTWNNSVVNGVSFVPTTSLKYVVKVTDDNNCSDTSSVFVAVNLKPKAQISASKTAVCQGDSIVLTATGAKNSTWNNSVLNGISFAPKSSLKYAVKVTDDNNCSDTSSVFVTVNLKPKAQIVASKTAVCQGDSVVLTATGAKNSTWNNSVVNGVGFVPTSSMKYAVKVTDDNNCSDTASITISVNSLPNKPTISLSSTNLVSSVSNGYQWFLNNQLLANETNQSLVVSKNGLYTVVVNDTYGCKNTSDAFEYKSLSLNDLKAGSLLIYPNPTSDLLTIINANLNHIEVVDINGQVLYTNVIISDKFQISMKDFAVEGVYFVNILDGNHSIIESRKIVLEK